MTSHTLIRDAFAESVANILGVRLKGAEVNVAGNEIVVTYDGVTFTLMVSIRRPSSIAYDQKRRPPDA